MFSEKKLFALGDLIIRSGFQQMLYLLVSNIVKIRKMVLIYPIIKLASGHGL